MNLSSLSDYGLVYLATPYTKYEGGHERAFEDASSLAGRIVNRGVFVFSPVAHGHPMSKHGAVSLCTSVWFPYNALFENACGALLIAQLKGWHESDGIHKEHCNFRDAHKPVFYLDPDDLRIDTSPFMKQVERLASPSEDWRAAL